ncbi:MAG: MFS transporter [Acidothermus sp.]|nr:MFS transporter [Acidothermus sp.]
MHTLHSAGDAMLTVALANTLFFAVDVNQARSRVALYLLVTMAPFAVVAPVVGPLLDRFRHGRRMALAVTQVARAFLAWIIADAVATKGGFALYPAAFGVLVCSKAYGVSRSAVVPRLLPPTLTLVKANARLTIFGILAATIGAPIGQGLNWATGSPAASLRIASLVYLGGAVLAFRLPQRADSRVGEVPMRPRHPLTPGVHYSGWRRILPPLHGVGPRMPVMLRANAGLRIFAGFLTLFLAFLVRTHKPGVFGETVDLGIIVAAAALGSFLGTLLGGWLKTSRPEPLVVASLLAAVVAGILAAAWFGLATAAIAILVADLCQSLAKLGLDSVIQRDVLDAVRTSAFARSETVLQLAWVAGGFLALVLPANGTLGLALGSAIVAGILVATVQGLQVSVEAGIAALRSRHGPTPSVRGAEETR